MVLKDIVNVVVKDWHGDGWEGMLTPCIDCCLWVESWHAELDAAGMFSGRVRQCFGCWREWGIIGEGRIVVGVHVGPCPLGNGGQYAGPEGAPPGWYRDPWHGSLAGVVLTLGGGMAGCTVGARVNSCCAGS